MPTYRNGIETRESLYNSAKRCFAANGYCDASIKEIVQAVNSKLGLFTYYFDGKEALALEIFHEIQNSIVELTLAVPSIAALSEDPLAINMACVRVWIETIVRNPHLDRFAREISITDAHLQYTVTECMTLWKFLNPDAEPSVTDRINCMLMAGMLLQFTHDMHKLDLPGCSADHIDHVLTTAYGLLVPDRDALVRAVAATRAAAASIRLRVDDTFAVSPS